MLIQCPDKIAFGICDMSDLHNPRLLPRIFTLVQDQTYLIEDWAGLLPYAKQEGFTSEKLKGYIAETKSCCGMVFEFTGEDFSDITELNLQQEPDWAFSYPWFKRCLPYSESIEKTVL